MKYMGKILLAIALLMLLCGMASAETVASGYCGHGGDGTTLSWTLTGEGTLTISGSGATATYSPQNRPPWFEYASQIKKVVLEGTIRTLGDYVFAEHPALEEIELPDSVQYINSYAFYETGLKSIHFPPKCESHQYLCLCGLPAGICYPSRKSKLRKACIPE